MHQPNCQNRLEFNLQPIRRRYQAVVAAAYKNGQYGLRVLVAVIDLFSFYGGKLQLERYVLCD